MESEIDTLVHQIQFTSALNLNNVSTNFQYSGDDWFNNTLYDLYVNYSQDNSCVITKNFIPKDTYIGCIMGQKKYIWEIEIPSPYIIPIDDDRVIDAYETPRCILAMVRHGFEIGIPENCALEIQHNEFAGEFVVWLKSIKIIECGEELIY